MRDVLTVGGGVALAALCCAGPIFLASGAAVGAVGTAWRNGWPIAAGLVVLGLIAFAIRRQRRCGSDGGPADGRPGRRGR